MKARIERIRVGGDAETYLIHVVFPEFPAPGGTTQTLVFETSIEEYQQWTPPNGVSKTPAHYVEHQFIRPAYTKLQNIHNTLKPLQGLEIDW